MCCFLTIIYSGKKPHSFFWKICIICIRWTYLKVFIEQLKKRVQSEEQVWNLPNDKNGRFSHKVKKCVVNISPQGGARGSWIHLDYTLNKKLTAVIYCHKYLRTNMYLIWFLNECIHFFCFCLFVTSPYSTQFSLLSLRNV